MAEQLFTLGIVTVLDRAVMAAYCQAYGRWVEAERKLNETPMILKIPSGYIQQNPWLTISNKQLELMHKYMSELGLSPVSRSRVSARPHHGPIPWEFGRSKSDGLLGQRPWRPRMSISAEGDAMTEDAWIGAEIGRPSWARWSRSRFTRRSWGLIDVA